MAAHICNFISLFCCSSQTSFDHQNTFKLTHVPLKPRLLMCHPCLSRRISFSLAAFFREWPFETQTWAQPVLSATMVPCVLVPMGTPNSIHMYTKPCVHMFTSVQHEAKHVCTDVSDSNPVTPGFIPLSFLLVQPLSRQRDACFLRLSISYLFTQL